ncbi:MAG TPA: hypothetical protein VG458_09545 [Solirubrobacterales bacterium]|nr:hypothetical protein [Solirubrobacterales bacterium]
MSERPGTGELVAGVAGFVLLLSMFILAWFGLEGFTGDAFEALDDWVTIVLVFASFAGMSLMLFGPDIPRADVAPLGAVTLALGALATLVVLIHIIAPPGVEAGSVSVDLDPEFGAWVGLFASIAIAIGGYLAIQEEERLAVGGAPGAGGAVPPQPQVPPAAPQQQAPPPQQQAPPPPPPPGPPPTG